MDCNDGGAGDLIMLPVWRQKNSFVVIPPPPPEVGISGIQLRKVVEDPALYQGVGPYSFSNAYTWYGEPRFVHSHSYMQGIDQNTGVVKAYGYTYFGDGNDFANVVYALGLQEAGWSPQHIQTLYMGIHKTNYGINTSGLGFAADGIHWQQHPAPPSIANLDAVAVSCAAGLLFLIAAIDASLLYIGQENSFGGITWSSVTAPWGAAAVDLRGLSTWRLSNGGIYLACAAGSWLSFNGGVSWGLAGNPPGGHNGVCGAWGRLYSYALGENALYVSENGLVWVRIKQNVLSQGYGSGIVIATITHLFVLGATLYYNSGYKVMSEVWRSPS